jgi:enolase
MQELYKKFCTDFPVVTIEDPFEQDDWDNCTALTAENICQVVGDDILVTNPTRVKKAIDGKTVNALLLKVRSGPCGAGSAACVTRRPAGGLVTV